VALGKSIPFEPGNQGIDLLGNVRGVSVGNDATDDFLAGLAIAVTVVVFLNSLAHFFSFISGVAAEGFKELVDLFLEDNDAKGGAENFFQVGVDESIGFTLAAGDVFVKLDGTADSGADTGLDNSGIFEIFGADANMGLSHGWGGGLRDADKLPCTHCAVDLVVIEGDIADVEVVYSTHGAAEYIIATQTEDIEFVEGVFGTPFIPLDDLDTVGSGKLDRDGVGNRGLGDDDSRGVGTDVSGEVGEAFGELENPVVFFARDVAVAEFGTAIERSEQAFRGDSAMEAFGEERDMGFGDAHDFADFAEDAPGAVGADGGDGGDVSVAIPSDKVLADIFAASGFEIDVDVGAFTAIGGEESVEVEFEGESIDAGDAEAVGDHGIHNRTTTTVKDTFTLGPLAHFPSDKEVA